jgi:hypothetical protein
MHRRSRFPDLLLSSALLLASLTALAQTPFSSLEERMTLDEYQAAGLDKLSSEELGALNDWIRSHSLGGEDFAAPAPAIADASGTVPTSSLPPSLRPERMGFADYEGEESPIESTLVGTFEGWRGDTTFELENGMVWVQDENDLLGVRPRENQRVVIEPGFLSAWYLRIDGVNKRLKVRRIR